MPNDRGVGAVGNRERIIDEDVAKCGQVGDQAGIVGFFAGMKP